MTQPHVMVPTNALDHALGVELQLIELVEQRARAVVQHRDLDAAALTRQIAALQQELAQTADTAAVPAPYAQIHDRPAGSALT